MNTRKALAGLCALALACPAASWAQTAVPNSAPTATGAQYPQKPVAATALVYPDATDNSAHVVRPADGLPVNCVTGCSGGGGGGGPATLAAGSVAAGAYASGSVLSGAFAAGSIVDLGTFKTASHTDLTAINTTLGSPFQAGGSIGNTAFGISGTLPAFAATPTVTIGNATIAVTGTFWQATQPVSGTFWQATQPISAASLPLPTGAATAALQPGFGTAGSAASNVVTVQGIAGATAVKVDGSGVTQPVSGTVTTTPPANASSNIAQVAGTTTDTNSGTKSAGTIRVVIATDQPALTNKLLVTPDSVALPANQSINESQVAGTTKSVNNGATDAGTTRVTISNDSTGQIKSTNWPATVDTNYGAPGASTPRVVMGTATTLCNLALKATATVCDASAANVSGIQVDNGQNSAESYVALYNVAQGSVTVGTTSVTKCIPAVPGGIVVVPAPSALAYGTAVTVAVTVGAGCTGTTAPTNNVGVSIDGR